MATDATGTPTTIYSIPKYDTAVDAPSGLGFNAAMDAIDTALDTVADAAISAPSGIASGEVPVWNGSAWVRSSVTRIATVRPQDLGQDSAASGDVMTWNGSIWAPAAPAASGATLIEHTEMTSNLAASGTYASPTTIIAGTARSYTAVPYLFEFFTPRLERTTSGGVTIDFYDGSTQIGRVAYYSDGNGGHGVPAHAAIRITPTAASHTYQFKAGGDGTGWTVYAGTGGGGGSAYAPAFMRITKDITV